MATAAAIVLISQEEVRAFNNATSHENQPSFLEAMEENNVTPSHDQHAALNSKREPPSIMMHCRMGHGDDSIVILNDSTAQDEDGYSPHVRRLLEELEQASRVMVGFCAATYLVGFLIRLGVGISMYCFGDICLRGLSLGRSNNNDLLMMIYLVLLVLVAVCCFQFALLLVRLYREKPDLFPQMSRRSGWTLTRMDRHSTKTLLKNMIADLNELRNSICCLVKSSEEDSEQEDLNESLIEREDPSIAATLEPTIQESISES